MLKLTSYFNAFGAAHFCLFPQECNVFEGHKEGHLSLLHFGDLQNKSNFETVFVCCSCSTKQQIQVEGTGSIVFNSADFQSWTLCHDSYFKSAKSYRFILNEEFFSLVEDPRPLLFQIKKLGLAGKLESLLIDLDVERHRYYKFSKVELVNFLAASGFIIQDKSTYLSVLIDRENYKKYLTCNNISNELIDSHYAILTTEDSKVGITGGIGTYVRNLKELCPQLAILNCNLNYSLEAISKSGGLSPYLFNQHYDDENYLNGLG